MAKKRKKRKTLSAPRTTKKVKRINRRRGKKGFLSELVTAQSAMDGAKAVASGGLGAMIAMTVDFVFPDLPQATRGLYKIGAGFVTASMLKMPYMGAGMAGAGTHQLLSGAFGLSEDDESANYADPIESLPMFMSEDGYMLSQGQAEYMLSQGDSYLLSEDGNGLYEDSIYPSYVPVINNQY